jgi:uncharacterized RDD family membrane protein YckC
VERPDPVGTVADGDAAGLGPRTFASWGRRTVALVIDGCVLVIPVAAMVALTAWGTSPDAHRRACGFWTCFDSSYQVKAGSILLSVGVGLALAVVYFSLAIGWRGRTVGMRVARIAVRLEDRDGTIGIVSAFERAFMVILEAALVVPVAVVINHAHGGVRVCLIILDIALVLPLVGDFLSRLWDPRRQTWHDEAVHSVVIDLKQSSTAL